MPPCFRSTDSRAILAASIETLPDPHRQAMRLYVLSEHDVERIGVEMGMPMEEAEQLIQHAAVLLRPILGRGKTKGDR